MLKKGVNIHGNKIYTSTEDFPPQKNIDDSKITSLMLVCSPTFSDELAAENCRSRKLN